jgi:CPA2 family monovalent cation:H+ antiporter-2
MARIPAVLTYIALGVLVSGLIGDNPHIHTIAEVGIVFLFFIVGMEFPMARMMEIGRRIWPAGILDVVLNLGVVTVAALLVGLDPLTAFIIGSVAYATSSSISVKLLEEQKRLANPEAEFILALLIFEDLVAPVLVSVLAGIKGSGAVDAVFLLILFFKILLLMSGAILIGYFTFRRLGTFIARHLERDFMPLMAAGIALGYAGLALALGLSEILGAFLAGMMLSETGRSQDVEHLFLPIRDVTLPFFFFWFGTTIKLGEGVPLVGFLVFCVFWAVAGKIITGYVGGRFFGLSPKVSIRGGISLVARGEFSAIIASLAGSGLRVFGGIYVVLTAFIGVVLFQQAPWLATRFHEWKKGRLRAGPGIRER